MLFYTKYTTFIFIIHARWSVLRSIKLRNLIPLHISYIKYTALWFYRKSIKRNELEKNNKQRNNTSKRAFLFTDWFYRFRRNSDYSKWKHSLDYHIFHEENIKICDFLQVSSVKLKNFFKVLFLLGGSTFYKNIGANSITLHSG